MRKLINFTIIALIFAEIVLISSIITSCSSIQTKRQPEYSGVDHQLEPYVKEFFELSTRNNISFKNKVTLGLSKIDRGAIIGICHNGINFREIDIDAGFFNEESELRKKALVFHELIHCYCTRGHDFDDGVDYPSRLFSMIAKKIPDFLIINPPGYLDDGCASSIMHPFIQEYRCLESHWDYYIKEMFNRCDPF